MKIYILYSCNKSKQWCTFRPLFVGTDFSKLLAAIKAEDKANNIVSSLVGNYKYSVAEINNNLTFGFVEAYENNERNNPYWG